MSHKSRKQIAGENLSEIYSCLTLQIRIAKGYEYYKNILTYALEFLIPGGPASGQEVIWSHAESLWKIVNEDIWKVPKELCKYFVQPIRGQELSVGHVS